MMPTFLELSKAAKRVAPDGTPYRIAVLGDSATQHLATAIKGYGLIAGLLIDVFDAEYGQMVPLIIQQESELYQSKPDTIVIYICVEKLYQKWHQIEQKERSCFAEYQYEYIKNIWDTISINTKSRIIQFTFAEYDDCVFGHYGCRVTDSFLYQTRKLNQRLVEGGASQGNVFFLDLSAIQGKVGREAFHDPKLFYMAKMPIALEALPYVAKGVVDIIQAIRGIIRKCVILDLDNTLWGGIIGEDGLANIQIGDLGIGAAYMAFQYWLKELKYRGILLAVVSKNNEETAKEVFEKHPDMVLYLDDFVAFNANWDDKAKNIRGIQQQLNIGMDSVVFIDDSQFERELVRSMVPEITVPEMPEDPALYISFLQSLNLFEMASYSDQDTNRTEQYIADSKRRAIEAQYANFDDYLKSLEMQAEVKSLDEYHIPRIAQLTQRSNQFNLRTVRYTEQGLKEVSNDENRITIYFTLRDKFADHGLVCVVILDKRKDMLFIDTLLMSCRVLKRGLEEFVFNTIFELARNGGYKRVIGEYIITPKNAIVSDLYDRIGFVAQENGLYYAEVGQYLDKKCFITRIE